MDEGVVSTPGNTRIDEIGKKAQDLIERINQSRAMDQKLMNSFEEKLMKKVLDVYGSVLLCNHLSGKLW